MPGEGGLPPELGRRHVVKVVLPAGLLAFVGAFGSLATCYGLALVHSFLGERPPGFTPHVQAVAMWSLGLLAVYAMWRDGRMHRARLPFWIGAGALAAIIFALYVAYDLLLEAFAYTLLVLAAVLNQNAFLTSYYQLARRQALQIHEMNRTLEQRVREQVREIEKLSRLRGFLPPQVADLVLSEGRQHHLGSHRRYIACLFCDVRGFTAAAQNAEPEDVIALLQEYHGRISELVSRHGGTIGFRAGDGAMAFFNDPLPCEEPVLDALKCALGIRDSLAETLARWRTVGDPVGLGLGVASGYATMGLVGSEGSAEYTAIGTVVNVASRLCDEAQDGEILMDRRSFREVEEAVVAKAAGPRNVQGISQPVETYNVTGLREEAPSS